MSRVRHRGKPPPSQPPSRRPWLFGLTVAVLALYVAIAYGHGLRLAFLNDDYFFLDKVRGASFLDLWKPEQLIFGWYRPWSRELHYWTLHHLAGLNEPIYHLVNFFLWIAVLSLYFVLVRRVAGEGAAAVATAGVAALGLWGGPVLWVAGTQDLWMLLFGLLALLAIARGRTLMALPPFALALLSKETAAALPSIAVAWLWIADHKPLRQAFRRTAAMWAVLIVWAVLHPTLSTRLLGGLKHSTETEDRPTAVAILVKTLLAQLNLGTSFAPEMGLGQILWPSLLGAAILGGFVAMVLWRRPATPQHRAILLGVVWAVCGWWILLLPSIGWHAYYGVLGTLGCWLALGTALSRYRVAAIAVVMALAVMREAQAATLSWDWGTDWYQTRAGTILRSIRARLKQLHPTFPPYSRLYFAEIPNAIGLLAGDGPAFRIWYDNPTLRAVYLSAYSVRSPADSSGTDYFFFFEPERVLIESESSDDPRWQHHHETLASIFVRSGNVEGAADEYGKLWRAFPARADFALYAAATLESADRPDEAREALATASRELGANAARKQAAALAADAVAYRQLALARQRRTP